MKLEHVGIYARNPTTLADWYCTCLGFTVARKLEREGKPPVFFLSLEDGGAQLEILPTEATSPKRGLETPGLTHLGLVVEDFASVEKRLKAEGVSVWGVRTTSSGWRIGYLNDPEDNILEVVQR
jgi:catechol 2,3-dioxygenase-like lactoylglutathione lyase family enzyme